MAFLLRQKSLIQTVLESTIELHCYSPWENLISTIKMPAKVALWYIHDAEFLEVS